MHPCTYQPSGSQFLSCNIPNPQVLVPEQFISPLELHQATNPAAPKYYLIMWVGRRKSPSLIDYYINF